MKMQIIAVFAMAWTSVALAEVEMTNLFTDHMVLQRELPVPIWGTASPGEIVTVSFNGQQLETKADNVGKWMVKLSPLETCKTGMEMVVKGSNTITIKDILVGEVWLCSGQSNMAGKFAPGKGRTLDPKIFEKDHSRLRFSSKNGGWEYRYLLAHLIKNWRETWAARSGGEPRSFPFYYVQVPSQGDEAQEYPWLRDSMRRALDLIDHTGMVVFYDYGPSLHPEHKEVAGERLALWALAKDYGHTELVHCGPLLDTVTINRDKAVLTFKHVGSGLKSMSGGKKLGFFEVAGKDAKYVPAEACIAFHHGRFQTTPRAVAEIHGGTKGNRSEES